MLVILDTNALVRFFTKDLPDKAQKVRDLLETEKDMLIPDVVFPEIEYVLRTQYSQSREDILNSFQFISSQFFIHITPQTRYAITLFAKTKLDMADCIVAAYSLKGTLASFDKELLKVEEIKPLWK